MTDYLWLADSPEKLKAGPGFLEWVDEINKTEPEDSRLRIGANREVAESEADAVALQAALEGVDNPEVRNALGYVAFTYMNRYHFPFVVPGLEHPAGLKNEV